ncbi:MAG: T9SS type A sorting domain-containing protein [Ignavibacteriota bacterium]
MGKLLFRVLVVMAGFLSFGESYGQGAFDSACYFPQMGNPNELDTIYGSFAQQSIGHDLALLPPLKGETNERLVMGGIRGNIPFLTAVETGPNFNLHKLKISKQYPFIFKFWPHIKAGHFRSPKYTDLMVGYGRDVGHPIIYWADENGEYDSSRYTLLLPHQMPPHGVGSGDLCPYVTRITSDSVDDILLSMSFTNLFPIHDSIYIVLIKGGQHLYDQGAVATWDDSAFWCINSFGNIDSVHRSPSQGDWRGIGREDLITSDDRGNFFYYKNDPPFDLHHFVKSLNDTLLVVSEWSHYKSNFSISLGQFNNMLSMRAFPKTAGDSSVDLLIPLPMRSGGSYDPFNRNGICIFKGGSDFGSKRLSFDSADFFLHCPGYLDANFSGTDWPGVMINCGDMTGTGNNVLCASAGYFTYGFNSLYVLGKAMDDKIDAFFSQNEGGYGGALAIHATNDGRTSFLYDAAAYQTPEDQNNGKFAKGSLQLLRSNEKIPVHLNPKFSGVVKQSFENSPEHILAYPNPCEQSTVLTFDNCTGGKMTIDVISTSGEISQHEETPGGFGLQQYGLSLTSLAPGNYLVRLSCISDGWSATTHIIKTGASLAPWRLDLKGILWK